jgi:hypothetical protein
MPWYFYCAITGAGFASGFINTLAGSGSLITLPLLIFLGLPAPVANGTNRVAILLQNVVATSQFKKARKLSLKTGLLLSVPAIAGALIGAHIAVRLSEETLRMMIGFLMGGMLVLLFTRPEQWLRQRLTHTDRDHHWGTLIVFFLIGVYGGFIQAGVGLLLLMGLVLGIGFDVVRANAVKVFIVLCFTLIALPVFIVHGLVQWKCGVALSFGQMFGAWIAARLAIEQGTAFVRLVLILVVLGGMAYLLHPWDIFI